MTKFNPDNKETLSYGEALGPAMEIIDPEDAAQYFWEYVKYIEKNLEPGSDKSAYEIAKINIGYYAGYYSAETRARIEMLFETEHPIFGSIAENGVPSPEEAYRKGLELAKSHKNEETQ